MNEEEKSYKIEYVYEEQKYETKVWLGQNHPVNSNITVFINPKDSYKVVFKGNGIIFLIALFLFLSFVCFNELFFKKRTKKSIKE